MKKKHYSHSTSFALCKSDVRFC